MKNSTDSFDPQSYWEQRLRNNPNVRGTGHRGFSVAYNTAMYGIAAERLHTALRRNSVDLTGKMVLDAGAGFGYFVACFIQWGAAHVTGIDLAKVSVEALRGAFPAHTFYQADVSAYDLPVDGNFDLVSAISVLFHILDDLRFIQAVGNLCAHTKPGGHIVIVDSFSRAPIPTARHTRLRSLHSYQPILRQYGVVIRDILPMLYLMGRGAVPWVGAHLSGRSWLLNRAVWLERWLGAHAVRSNWGGMKFMIAQRV